MKQGLVQTDCKDTSLILHTEDVTCEGLYKDVN